MNAPAKINERVTVTPYDIRFPSWCVMAAQAMGITWHTMNSMPILAVTCMTCIAVLAQGCRGKYGYLHGNLFKRGYRTVSVLRAGQTKISDYV